MPKALSVDEISAIGEEGSSRAAWWSVAAAAQLGNMMAQEGDVCRPEFSPEDVARVAVRMDREAARLTVKRESS